MSQGVCPADSPALARPFAGPEWGCATGRSRIGITPGPKQLIYWAIVTLLGLQGCVTAIPDAGGPLFEILADGERVAWLAGSVHLLRKRDYPMPVELDNAFENAASLAVEIDPLATGVNRMQGALVQNGRRRDLLSQSFLTSETQQRLFDHLQRRHESPDTYAHMQPWLIDATIAMIAAGEAGFVARLGVDSHYLQRARRRNLEIFSLETLEEQLGALTGASLDQQDLLLRNTLTNFHKASRQLDEAVAAWRTGRFDQLLREQMSLVEQYPSLEGYLWVLIQDRNTRMLPRIRSLIDNGNRPLILVGALHLPGEAGLVNLLGEFYDVRRVASTGLADPHPEP